MKTTYAPSPNCDERPGAGAVDTLIIHYTGMESAEKALARMCNPNSQVSAHYMIAEDGEVFQLVDEKKRAWHAGASYWRGKRGINAYSIGIELVNPGHEFGYRVFSDPQMASLIELGKKVFSRNMIKPYNIVGHADIAPERKQDPGELFDWKLLAQNGLGIYPEPIYKIEIENFKLIDAQKLLNSIGYETPTDGAPSTLTSASLAAFARHFAPDLLQATDIKYFGPRLVEVEKAFREIATS